VKHVALLKSSIELNGTTQTFVYQCNPPIISGELTQTRNSESQAKCSSIDILADINLDLDEENMIETWLAGVDRENYELNGTNFQQYHLVPHMSYASTETGRSIRRRFSCAGFVLEAYRSAEIDLITTDSASTESSLPIVELETLRHAYSDLFWILDNPRIHQRFDFRGISDLGLEEGTNWRILLPGYLFHSTVRVTSADARPSPYTPESALEGQFPYDVEQ
jgi:hypothetical protein